MMYSHQYVLVSSFNICQRRLAGVSAFIVHSGHHIYTAGKFDYMAADRNHAARHVYAKDKRAPPPASNLRLHTTRAYHLTDPICELCEGSTFFWSEILSSNIRWYTDATANIHIYAGDSNTIAFFIVVCAGSLLFECCGQQRRYLLMRMLVGSIEIVSYLKIKWR